MSELQLIIKGTRWTPEVLGDTDSCLTLTGESSPDDCHTFFEPVFDWIRDTLYVSNKLNLNLNLTYYNTSTAKVLYEMFDLMQSAYNRDAEIHLTWYSQDLEDIETQEIIEDLKDEYNFPMNFVEAATNE